MNDSRANETAMANLDRALRTQHMDLVTYHHYKDQVDTLLSSVNDNGQTCRRDLVNVLASVPVGKMTLRRALCTNCDHWSISYIDAGYGCGYRNTQMLLSSIREDPHLRDIIFNNSKNRFKWRNFIYIRFAEGLGLQQIL